MLNNSFAGGFRWAWIFFHLNFQLDEREKQLRAQMNFKGLFDHSTLQKMITTLCIMAYAILTDLVDGHIAMEEFGHDDLMFEALSKGNYQVLWQTLL
jgi:phosphatidylglycerophosphate synthase